MLAGDAHGAEAVEDGDLEAADLAEGWVDVERVAVAVETVQSGLILAGLLLDDGVGLAGRRLVGGDGVGGAGGCGLGRATEAAGAADEHGGLVVEELLAVGGVLGGEAHDDDGGVALVDHVDELGVRNGLGRGGDGVFADLEVLLTVEEHHGGEVGDQVVEVPGGSGVEPGDNTEGRDGLEVLVVLIDEREVSALGTEGDVVEDDFLVLVVKGGSVGLHLLGGSNGIEDLLVTLGLLLSTADVAHVGHDGLGTGSRVLGMVSTAIVKVDDLGPLLINGLGGQRDVDGESVTARALPSGAAEPTATALEETLGDGLGELVRAEGNDNGGNLVGLEGTDDLLGHDGGGHLSASVGSDGVAADVVLGALDGNGAGETEDTELSSSIVGLAEVAVDTAGASGVDDTAILLLEHVWPGSLGASIGATEVDVHDGVPQLVGHVGEGFVTENTSVVDKDIDAAIVVNGRLDDSLAILDGGTGANSLAASLDNLLNNGVGVDQVVNDDSGAKFSKKEGVGTAKTESVSNEFGFQNIKDGLPVASTGNDGDLAGEVEGLALLVLGKLHALFQEGQEVVGASGVLGLREVVDLIPLLEDSTGSQGVASPQESTLGTLPSDLSDVATTSLEDGASLLVGGVDKLSNYWDNPFGSKVLENLWGHDGLGHTGGSCIR